ncbi:ArsR family transcriptional regulator [Streptomyces coeruleorubidus]|uniref:ArsR family transcriptional regulator n=1 Tax=Streptomyces coeruleorubidus TaxID=116188 RepID=UPI0036C08B05
MLIAMTNPARRWTFLTNHATVLRAIAQEPDARLSDIAAVCRITERGVQAITIDLEQAGYLQRRRAGRRNQYILNLDQPLRHPAETGLHVRALVGLGVEGVSQKPLRIYRECSSGRSLIRRKHGDVCTPSLPFQGFGWVVSVCRA